MYVLLATAIAKAAAAVATTFHIYNNRGAQLKPCTAFIIRPVRQQKKRKMKNGDINHFGAGKKSMEHLFKNSSAYEFHKLEKLSSGRFNVEAGTMAGRQSGRNSC